MAKFTLVGVDGNAFSIIGYTARALRKAGLKDMIPHMESEATSGDYNHLIATCDRYIEIANDALGLTEEDEEE